MSLQGLVTINIPPTELIKGQDKDILYNEMGSIVGDSNFTYDYGTANPVVTLGGAAAGNTGTIRLGGATGSGSVVANTVAIISSSGITANGGSGVFEHIGTSSKQSPLVSLKSTNPVFEWNGTNNGADMKRWQIYMDGSGNLFTIAVSDDGNTSQNCVQITRSGTNVTSHRYYVGGSLNMSLDSTGLNVTGDVNNSGSTISKTVSAANNPAAIASASNTGATIGGAANYALLGLYDATQAANNRSFDLINFQNKIQFRLKNDSGSATVTPLTFNGGYTNFSGINSNSGTGAWSHTGFMTINATSTAAQSSLAIVGAEPGLEIYSSSYNANRRRWFIESPNATASLIFGLASDDGNTKSTAYQLINTGAGHIGVQAWSINGVNTMALNPSGLTVGTTTVTTSDNSALLELQSGTQGFLLPRMSSAQRNSIANPADGLLVYDNIVHDLYVYKAGAGGGWKVVTTTS